MDSFTNRMADRAQAIKRVLVLTLIANLAVALGKLIVGMATGALSMVADGIHSMLDGTSNVVGLVGNYLAARPADADHPYGHRRFETLASLMIGGMLLVTAWEIVKDATAHLMDGTLPHITALNFITMLVTLAINIGVSLYERREGARLRSEFLVADSEHTRSDALVSLSVLVSLIAVGLGISWADSVAAFVVVALIGVAAWRIIRRSANILVDGAVLDPAEVTRIAEGVPGIQRVYRVRSRGPADDIQLDLDIEIAGPTTAAHSEVIGNEIRARLRQHFNGLTDIQVHFTTALQTSDDYALIARAEADALGVGVHEVIAANDEHGLTLEMHIEVPRDQSVEDAHAVVTEFEDRLVKKVPELQRIVTHIEPAHTPDDVGTDDGRAHILARQALAIARRMYPDHNWHDLAIRAESDGGYAISLHCHVPGQMSLEAAHLLAEKVETRVRAELAAVHRLTIHTEPSAKPQ